MNKKNILDEEETKHRRKLRRSALRHYENMIMWVETQNLNEMPRRASMSLAIGEDWGAYNCMYCSYFDCCIACVLYVPDERKFWDHCCGGLWAKLDESETWQEWLKHAGMVVKFIKRNG